MYNSFYTLAEKPFKIDTDPRFLWCGEKHAEALANLRYGLTDNNGFVVLTGDIGTGKTTLVNALLDTLDINVHLARINHPSLDMIEFLTLVARTFDPAVSITGKIDLVIFFNTFFQQIHGQGKMALLIVDEAHRLSPELLEEIRLLSNIEKAGQRLLNIILVGQNELNAILLSPQCRALRQRITLHYEIQALNPEETVHYVEHRLKVSGVQDEVFSASAMRRIYTFSKGNPRLINILCDRALLTGFVKARKDIDAEIILECAREMDLNYTARSGARAIFLQGLIAWQRNLSTELATRTAALKQLPPMAAKLLYRRLIPDLQQLRTRAETTTRTVVHTCSRLIIKHRRKIISSTLATAITCVFLVLTIGAYKAADQRKYPPVSDNQVYPSGQPPPSANGYTTAAGHLAPKAETRTVDTAVQASMPSSQESDKAESAAGQIRIPASSDSSPRGITAAEPQPTPAQLAEMALAHEDFQKVIDLFEAQQRPDTDKNSVPAASYAKALVGRAKEIMSASPLQAETLLRRAIETAPVLAEAYLELGKLYTRTKDDARAIEAYQKAVQYNPGLSDAYFNLGFIYATNGHFADAERAFAKVVALKPPYLDKSLFNLAVVQQKLGKTHESIANLEMAAALSPGNEKALAYLDRLKASTVSGTAKQGM